MPCAQVKAVLDWELATLGNPWSDVAYAAMAYHLPASALPMLALQQPLLPGVGPALAPLAEGEGGL